MNALTGELTRRTNNRDKALQALEQAGAQGVTNVTLMQVAGARAGSRVQELRDRGYVITCDHERDGVWRYTLHTGTPDRVRLVTDITPTAGRLF